MQLNRSFILRDKLMSLIKPKDYILNTPAYIAGKHSTDSDHNNRAPIILSANENPLGASPKVNAMLAKHDQQHHRYPDGSAHDLRHLLAQKNNVSADNIVVGAGSDELITLIMRCFAGVGDEVIYSQHGFLMYMITAKSLGVKPVAVTEINRKTYIEGIIRACNANTKIIFIANPNNPTGTYITRHELQKLCQQVPRDVLIVIDQAYVEYCDQEDYQDAKSLLADYDNLCVIQTFSKIYGLAALRLGWGVFPDIVCDALNRVRSPFNVSSIAQAAGILALEDDAHIEHSITVNNEAKEYIENIAHHYDFNLSAAGNDVQGNFLLLDFGKSDDAKAFNDYCETHHILLRAMGGYGLPQCLRLTLGTMADMESLHRIFDQYYSYRHSA